MVVEYVSAMTAAIILFYVPKTGLFQLAQDVDGVAIEGRVIVELLLYQIVPEFFCDVFCTLIEIIGGLREFHLAFWGWNITAERNFEKAFILKCLATLTTTALILISTMT
jgi:hypothetical protein